MVFRVCPLVLMLLAVQYSASSSCPAGCSCTNITIVCRSGTFNLDTISDNVRGNITELTLENCHLPYLNASILVNFTSLNALTIRFCGLETIDESSLVDLPLLSFLDVTSNSLSQFSVQRLEYLQSLLIAHNRLTNLSLPEMKSLKYLDISDNSLTNVTNSTFSNCTNLLTLTISDNALQIEDGSLEKLTQLEELYMRNISKFSSGVLKGLQNLKILHIGPGTAPVSDKLFDGLNKLESVDLNSDNISSTNIAQLPKTVKSLDLSRTSLANITENLFIGFPNLTSLNLSNQRLRIDENAFVNTSLTSLCLVNCSLNQVPISVLSNLRDVDVNFNDNNFTCTCDYYAWFRNNTVKYDYICTNPWRLVGLNLKRLSPELIGCAAPIFTNSDIQPVLTGFESQIVCEAKSYYELPVLNYTVQSGNPLGILNSSAITRHIWWSDVELRQVRYHSALEFVSKRPEVEQTGQILCQASNQWGVSVSRIAPDFQSSLLLPAWAIAVIVALLVILILVVILGYCVHRKRKRHSISLNGISNGHIRQIVV